MTVRPSIEQARHEIERDLLVERMAFAAKVRSARAVLSLSQHQFGRRIGLSQKSIHRIEQGVVQPKLQTMLRIEKFWSEQGLLFESLRCGGFRLVVERDILFLNENAAEHR